MLEDGRKLAGGMGDEARMEEGGGTAPSGAVGPERKGYVRFESLITALGSSSSFLSQTPTDRLLHKAPPSWFLALDEDV